MTGGLPNALYVGGEWSLSSGGGFEAIINPANESVIGEAPVGGLDDLENALASARDAFDRGPWPRMSVRERVALMERFWAALAARRDEIVGLLIREAGATQMIGALMQFDLPMKHARQLMDDALRLTAPATPPQVTPTMDGRLALGAAVSVYEPYGVVAAITPYNYPFFLNVVKLFHALPMGNVAVLKPSPFTPFAALILGDAATAAGLPPGVLNIVTGGLDVATRLTVDPRVDMVSFTGSDNVGAAIMAQAAPTLKKMHLELGGKSALIVRQDAELPKCMESALMFTVHAGQGCALPTRHLVHNAIRRDYVAMLSHCLQAMKVGDPADPSVQIGPMIRPAAVERTVNYVAMGLDSGARLAFGGQRPGHLAKGYYYEPTYPYGGGRLAGPGCFSDVWVIAR